MADHPFAAFESTMKDMMQSLMPNTDANATVGRLMEAYTKNMETLAKVNAVTMGGAQALMSRHMEMIQKSVAEFQANAADVAGASSPVDAARRQAQHVEAAVRKAMEDLKQMAEIAQAAQTDAADVIKARIEESAAEFQSALKRAEPAKKPKA